MYSSVKLYGVVPAPTSFSAPSMSYEAPHIFIFISHSEESISNQGVLITLLGKYYDLAPMYSRNYR